MTRTGPRDLQSVLETRYWLTDKGWLTATALENTQPNNHPQETP